jgi:hypothetical protein
MLLLSQGTRIGRRSTKPRGEGPTGVLPGLAAAAKKQLPHHVGLSITVAAL